MFTNFDDKGFLTAASQVEVPIPGNPKAARIDFLPAAEGYAWRAGKPVTDIPTLGAAIAADPEVGRCAVNRVWNYAMSRGDIVNDLATIPNAVTQPYVNVVRSWRAEAQRNHPRNLQERRFREVLKQGRESENHETHCSHPDRRRWPRTRGLQRRNVRQPLERSRGGAGDPNGTAGSEDTTFDHSNDPGGAAPGADFQPAEPGQVKLIGSPEITSRLHACGKISLKSLGDILTSPRPHRRRNASGGRAQRPGDLQPGRDGGGARRRQLQRSRP